MSKSRVAKESVLKYNPDVKIKSYHGNVKDSTYGPSFIKQFDLVLNALDNLSARRHVNRVCLAVGVPLVESGTAGYLGQVQPIIKTVSECFECAPKPSPTTYPVCTIRSNPTKPIHCIIWAKMLFLRLFGKSDDSNAVTDLEETNQQENNDLEELDENEREGVELAKKFVEDDKMKLEQEKDRSYERWIFHKVFHTDVLYLCTLKTLWKGKQEPKPLLLDQLLASMEVATPQNSTGNVLIPDQQVWNVKQNAEVFLKVAKELKASVSEDNKVLEWEKDDDLHLDFVTAASNLRCSIFHLPLSSRFDVKSEAGNVIPAIATTNAIIAGLMVLEAYKILNKQKDRHRYHYLYKNPTRGKLILTARLLEPNPSCYICGSKFANLKINTATTTLNYFMKEVISKHLNIGAPSIFLGETCIYEAAGGEDEDDMGMDYQLPKTLQQLNIIDNTILKIEDFNSDYELQLSITHQTKFPSEEVLFELSGDKASKKHVEKLEDTPQNPEAEDDLQIISGSTKNAKRKREQSTENTSQKMNLVLIDE
eukprot:TRINITY_DN4661_c0_g1_i1.p1 TRINITY_DN4661_c0_g1~~TRINITY_DN4661_c0_g1_i1.p1  ORF type:complete len:618 (+),score=145.04 TRINITY_DN4661_c0_g1_i1:245-1855(+)